MVNTTYQAAPWADVLYAMDRGWWLKYVADVKAQFKGERATRSNFGPRFGATVLDKMKHYNNSGAAAISLAAYRGASKIIMLGYDCQHTGGKKHWHGDHPKGLGNAGAVMKWGASFKELAAQLQRQGVEVVNCSRETALDCFPRQTLEAALCES